MNILIFILLTTLFVFILNNNYNAILLNSIMLIILLLNYVSKESFELNNSFLSSESLLDKQLNYTKKLNNLDNNLNLINRLYNYEEDPGINKLPLMNTCIRYPPKPKQQNKSDVRNMPYFLSNNLTPNNISMLN